MHNKPCQGLTCSDDLKTDELPEMELTHPPDDVPGELADPGL